MSSLVKRFFRCLPQSIKAQGPFLEKLFLQTTLT